MRKYISGIILILVASWVGTSHAQQGTNTGSAAGSGSQSLQAQGIEAQQAQGGTISGGERFLRENRELGQVIGGATEGVGMARGTEDAAAGQTGRGGISQFGRGNSAFGNLFNQLNQFNQSNRQTSAVLKRQHQGLLVAVRKFRTPKTVGPYLMRKS